MALLEEVDLTTLWALVVEAISSESPQHRAFLALTKPLGLLQGEVGATLLLSTPNQFAKDVWEELAEQGKLKRAGRGLYELVEV